MTYNDNVPRPDWIGTTQEVPVLRTTTYESPRRTSTIVLIVSLAVALVLTLGLAIYATADLESELEAERADDTVVQYEDGTVTRINDGLVSYEQLATDPFGWEDFDVIPKSTWLNSISVWNDGTDDERMAVCELMIATEDEVGIEGNQNEFVLGAMDMGATEDEAWTFYAVAVTGCEEISQF